MLSFDMTLTALALCKSKRQGCVLFCLFVFFLNPRVGMFKKDYCIILISFPLFTKWVELNFNSWLNYMFWVRTFFRSPNAWAYIFVLMCPLHLPLVHRVNAPPPLVHRVNAPHPPPPTVHNFFSTLYHIHPIYKNKTKRKVLWVRRLNHKAQQ